MQRDPIIIRSSPFLFLKRLIIIEFFFALLPFLIAWLIHLLLEDLTQTYQILPFAGSVSFTLFTAVVATTAQVLIVAIAFLTWYIPVFLVDGHEIVHQRGDFLGDKKLASTPFIDQVAVKQGWLAKRLNYGTLIIIASDSPEQPHLKDVPDPFRHAELIVELAEPGMLNQVTLQPRTAMELVLGGERQDVEFKSSLVWDYYQGRANKSLHEPVMKTVVAFLNSSGGYLLIGVDDDGRVLGLEPDLQTLRKPNADGFETTLNMSFNKMIGVEFRQFVDVIFPLLDGKTICMLRVQPSTHPAYLVNKGNEKFYIRAGNASQSLTISQANRYIQRRFNN
jgi:hypothetical protein